MNDNDIELCIRKYKSLPSNLDSYEYENFDISDNPLVMKQVKFNTIGIGTDCSQNDNINLGIVGNFIMCFKNMQNYLEKTKIWNNIKITFGICFPYILHYYTHLIFIIVFEIIFYFKYAVIIEKQLIHDLVTSMVSTIVDIYFEYNKDANKIELTQEMVDAICDKYNQLTNSHNDVIYENCLIGIIVLISVFSIIILIGTRLYGYKLVLGVIADSIMLIMLLGIFEYFFFAYIVLGYKIITMGEIICIAVNAVYLYMNTN